MEVQGAGCRGLQWSVAENYDLVESERSEHTVVLSLNFLSIYVYIYI